MKVKKKPQLLLVLVLLSVCKQSLAQNASDMQTSKQTMEISPTTSNTQKMRPTMYEAKRREIFGRQMAYIETGTGDPIVFLHGNPTSSYLWRNIIPYLQDKGRCIAPDLIGMGASDKLIKTDSTSYTFEQHRQYLDKLLSDLDVRQRVTFVVHDWGSALAFDWAYRHPNAVKGIAYMEAIVVPYSINELPEIAQKIFGALRSPAGEEMVLQQNSFIEINLPNTIMRKLSEEEMNNYRKPFINPGESRRVMLSWARQLPFDGRPENVAKIVKTYAQWLAKSDIPKLYIEAIPGTMSPSSRAFCKTWANQITVSAKGIHYVQEDSPDEIGIALSTWYQTLDNNYSKHNHSLKNNNQIMSTQQTEKNKQTVRSLYEDILNPRKFDRLQEIISEDYTGVGGVKGIEGFTGPTLSVIGGFPDIIWTIDELLAVDDKVIVRWHWSGTNTAPFRGVPASNKQVTDNAIVIYQLKDDKIIHAWLQGDRLGVLLQIGAIPANLVPGIPNSQTQK